MFTEAKKPRILGVILVFQGICILLCHVQQNVHQTAADAGVGQIFGLALHCKIFK